jgi:hypothetical protein
MKQSIFSYWRFSQTVALNFKESEIKTIFLAFTELHTSTLNDGKKMTQFGTSEIVTQNLPQF